MLSEEEQKEFEQTLKKQNEVLTKIANAKMTIRNDEEALMMFEKYRNVPLEKLDGASRWCVIGGGYGSVAEMLDAIKEHIEQVKKRIKRLCLKIPDGYYNLPDGSTLLNVENWERYKKQKR